MGHRKKKSTKVSHLPRSGFIFTSNFHPRCCEIHLWVPSTGLSLILWLLVRFQNAKRDQNKINLVLLRHPDLARNLLLTGLFLALTAVTAPSAALKKAKLCAPPPPSPRAPAPLSPARVLSRPKCPSLTQRL